MAALCWQDPVLVFPGPSPSSKSAVTGITDLTTTMSPVILLFFKMMSPPLLNPLHTEPTLHLHPFACLLVDSESEPSSEFGGRGRGLRRALEGWAGGRGLEAGKGWREGACSGQAWQDQRCAVLACLLWVLWLGGQHDLAAAVLGKMGVGATE